jgi:tetratricopeptide (TPR) repeat protein
VLNRKKSLSRIALLQSQYWRDSKHLGGTAFTPSENMRLSAANSRLIVPLLPPSADNSEPYLQLAVLYAENEQWPESRAASQRLVELGPQDDVGYLALSGVYHELKQYPEEIETCNQALRVNPKSLPALEGLANAYAETSSYEKAVTVLRQAITLDPDKPDLHAWLAQSYVELGDLQAAKEEHRTLQKVDAALAADLEKFLASRTKQPE